MTTGEGGGLDTLDGLHLAWNRRPELPGGDEWLSVRERVVLDGLVVPKRQADWRLGRWAAKRAVRSLLQPVLDEAAPSSIEILAHADGRPVVGIEGVHLSISHSAGVGCAVASAGEGPIGCDVEGVEPRTRRFVSDYFTARESAAVHRAGPETAALITNLIWSAKESALKVLGQGLRLDTRQVEVDAGGWVEGGPLTERITPGEWHPLRASGPGGARFEGSWRVLGGLVWTVLTGR